jgi:hypothetical protein
MTKAQTTAVASAVTILLLALADASGSSAYAGPNVPQGRYCLTYDVGGSDCSFTSYPECLATASGIDAECFGKTIRDDLHDRMQTPDSYAQVRSFSGWNKPDDRLRGTN